MQRSSHKCQSAHELGMILVIELIILFNTPLDAVLTRANEHKHK